MTQGQRMAQAMTHLMTDAVSAAAILDSSELARMREGEKNSQVFLRILRSNVENRRNDPSRKMLLRLLDDFEINVREQSGWALTE